MAQKTPLTTLTVMYADRWNGTWFMELGNFQEQLIKDYQVRFLITGFLRLKRQWLQYLSIIKSGLFYFFQIVVLNYLSKFKKWQSPVLQNPETKKKLKNWLMHLKTEFSLKNSFLAKYLKLKQRLFKNFISAQKTRILKNLTLFGLVDNNNNFNYNSENVSKKEAVLVLKNFGIRTVNNNIPISHFLINSSLYLKGRSWDNFFSDLLVGFGTGFGITGSFLLIYKPELQWMKGLLKYFKTSPANQNGEVVEVDVNEISNLSNLEIKEMLLFPQLVQLPPSSPINVKSTGNLSPRISSGGHNLVAIDDNPGDLVLIDAEGGLLVPEPLHTEATIAAARTAWILWKREMRAAGEVLYAEREAILFAESQVKYAIKQRLLGEQRVKNNLYEQSVLNQFIEQQKIFKARKLLRNQLDPLIVNYEPDTSQYPQLSTITDVTGTRLVPQVNLMFGDSSVTSIVNGVPVGEETNKFFARVQLDSTNPSDLLIHVKKDFYFNYIFLVEQVWLCCSWLILLVIVNLILIVYHFHINNSKLKLVYQGSKEKLLERPDYLLYWAVLIIFTIEQFFSRFFILFIKLRNILKFFKWKILSISKFKK